MRSKHATTSSCPSRGILVGVTAAPSLVVLFLLALSIFIAEAFSVSSSSRTSTSQMLVSSPSRALFSSDAPSSRNSQQSSKPSLVVSYASLRDIVESSNNDEDDKSLKNKDGKVDKSLKKRYSSQQQQQLQTPQQKQQRSNDFNNLLNYSRSKFTDTKFRSRASVYGTGGSDYDRERSRSSTFSFSKKNQGSGSEGGRGVGTLTPEEEEEEVVEMIGGGDNEDSEDSSSVGASPVEEGEDETKEATATSGTGSPTDVANALNSLRGDTMIADNFNDMVGTFYSNRKYPTQEKKVISDEDDAMGLHGDRLSTFSFSEKEAVMMARSSFAAAGEDGIDIDEENVANYEGEDVEDVDEEQQAPSKKVKNDFNEASFGPDNFHSSINVNMSFRNAAPSNRGSNARADGIDNHYDRLSTFSLAKDGGESTSSTSNGNGGGGSSATTGEDQGGRSPLGPRGARSFRDKVNHDDRLGTFSFASSEQSSGSTSAKGTSSTDPLASTNDSTIKPVNHHPKQQQQQQQQQQQGSSDTQRRQQQTTSISQITTATTPHPLDQVYTSPNKGSLSTLASSVYTTTRNDRIKQIKAATDPRLLHPDGMNVPRLNSKGDVMSLSSSGRPDMFQRIANRDGEGAETDADDSGAAKGGGTSGSFLRNLAEVAEERSKDIPIERSPGFVGFQSDIEEEEAEKDKEQEEKEEEPSVDDSIENGDCFIGFDLGTSGARMSIVEKKQSNEDGGDDAKWEYGEVFTATLAWDEKLKYDNANDWRAAIDSLLSRAKGSEVMSRVKAICVSGTSATCVLVDKHTLDVSRGSARMYNYDILSSSDSNYVQSPAKRVMKLIDEFVPEKHTARATTGSLAKLLLWNEEESLVDANGKVKEVLCHQSDYVSMSLVYDNIDDELQKPSVTSDWHNCLKLGYDVQRREFPEWMHKLLKEGANIPDPESILPSKVISPGEPFGVISPAVASKFGLPSNVMLVGGTTDSNAAFFAAAGAQPQYGTAVTSLGSTLAIKQLSKTFVEDASRGVYSHRFPRFGESDGEDEAWLIGGASNVGCAILRQEGFSNEELSSLSTDIDPETDSPLTYYPLMKKGERFPVADSDKEPVLEPKPDSRKEYLHGILQGIGDVERDGFRILGDLGARPVRPTVVLSCGGGARNDVWISMRERRLKDICHDDQPVAVKRAVNTEASYGAALLAAASF